MNICEDTFLENTKVIYRRAQESEYEKIIVLQSNIFHTEQGIPEDNVNEILSRLPICWCAELDGEIIGTALAWKEQGIMHWGRFVVIPSLRGHHIGPSLARFTFEDLFSHGVDEIHMTARDTTVKIVCDMGGQVTGEPMPFYEGNVTPVVLKRENFV